jgi:pantoate--beta-alanine ligase
MHILHNITKVRKNIKAQKTLGASIGFIPTMGALHRGHLSLIEKSASQNDLTVVSIFVNPLQFAPNEDLAQYPSTPQQDIERAESAGADLIFHPAPRDILGDNILTFVDINNMQDNLCGRSRPGHFRGVCTIVTKLFNIVTPDRAYFGQKDIQQFLILKKMVADLNFNIQMIRCPIIREPDGLAMSSRNTYLSPSERQDAAILSRAIKQAVAINKSGINKTNKIVSQLSEFISQNVNAKIDYINIVDENMRDVSTVHNGHILALAVYIGSTRLIDNHIFGDDISF